MDGGPDGGPPMEVASELERVALASSTGAARGAPSGPAGFNGAAERGLELGGGSVLGK